MESLDVLMIWLGSNTLAALQARYVAVNAHFEFPFTTELLWVLAGWIFAAIVRLVFNKGDTVKEAFKEDLGNGKRLWRLLFSSGLLLGVSMAAKGSLTSMSLQHIPLLMACSPAVVYIASLVMGSEAINWQHGMQIAAVCVGAGAALFTSMPAFTSWAAYGGLALQVVQLLSISIASCMLHSGLKSCADSSHSSSRASTPSSSSRRSSSGSLVDVEGCVVQSTAVAVTYIAPVAAAMIAIPAVVLEGPRLFATFYGWQAAAPAVLASAAAAAVSNVLAIKVIQATSATTVAMSKVTGASLFFVLGELHSPTVMVNIPGAGLPTVNLVGCATAVVALLWYAFTRVQKAMQRQKSVNLPQVQDEAFWAKKDPTSVVTCSGTAPMAYVQPHRYNSAKSSAFELSQQGSYQLSPQGSYGLHSVSSAPASAFGAAPAAAVMAAAAAAAVAAPVGLRPLKAVRDAHDDVMQLSSFQQAGLAY